MASTQIGWADFSHNPWIGCEKVSPACKLCYADRDWGAFSRFNRARWGAEERGGTRSLTSHDTQTKPLSWDRMAASAKEIFRLMPKGAIQFEPSSPRRRAAFLLLYQMGLLKKSAQGYWKTNKPWRRPTVFCASLSDLFEDWSGPMVDHHGKEAVHPDGQPMTMDYVRAWFLREIVDETPNLTWLLLTKRIDRAAAILSAGSRENVVIGVSAENQEYFDARVGDLLKAGEFCAGTFVSAEPLLGPLDVRDYAASGNSPKWIVSGCETGPKDKIRHSEVGWFVDLRSQCDSAGIPFFMKQVVVDGKVETSVAKMPAEVAVQQLMH